MLEYIFYQGHRHEIIAGTLRLCSFIGKDYKIKKIQQLEGLENLKDLRHNLGGVFTISH